MLRPSIGVRGEAVASRSAADGTLRLGGRWLVLVAAMALSDVIRRQRPVQSPEEPTWFA